jgi:hypothetical protein
MIVKTGLSRPTKHKEIIDLQDLQLINELVIDPDVSIHHSEKKIKKE